jgi:PAS domain S-box-containing protein
MARGPIRPPELSELEVFVLAVDEGSITRAAARLQISAPAAAKRIRQLEVLAHEPLLIRGARGVVATELGERLYPIAREALAQRARFVEVIAGAPSSDPLRIAGMHRMLGRAAVPASEDLVKEAEAVLAAIFHAASDAILLIGPEDGVIHEINDAAASLFGYEQEHLRGLTVLETDLWDQPERADASIEAALAGGEPQHTELVLRTRAGVRRLVAARFEVIKVRECTYLLVTVRDCCETPAAAPYAANGSSRPNEVDRELADQFLDALRNGGSEIAQGVARAAITAGLDLADVHTRVIAPAMRSIGSLWERNEISVADEHLATAISHDVAARLLWRSRTAQPRSGPSVIMAGVEGEHHVLGLRLATDVLDSAGYDTRYLGADVPLSALLDACLARRPAVVGLTVGMPENVPTLLREVAELGRLEPAPQVIVGGRVSAQAIAQGLTAPVVEHSEVVLAIMETLTLAIR